MGTGRAKNVLELAIFVWLLYEFNSNSGLIRCFRMVKEKSEAIGLEQCPGRNDYQVASRF